jgi:hypothetical protein
MNLASGYDEGLPEYLHPGYVSAGASGGPGAAGQSKLSSLSIENWCRKVPVLDLLGDPVTGSLSAEDLVGNISLLSTGAADVSVPGHNLGNRPGKIVLSGLSGGAAVTIDRSPEPYREDWSDSQLRFTLKGVQPGSYYIRFAPDGGLPSVGRFVLKVNAFRKQPTPDPETWDNVKLISAPLQYSEKVRKDTHPVGNGASGTANTSGLVGAVEGVSLRIDGYTKLGSHSEVAHGIRLNVTVWRADPGASAPSSEFDGAATAELGITGGKTFRRISAIVNLNPDAAPNPPLYSFTGTAAQMPDFQKAFEKKVETEIARVLMTLKGPVALSADQQKLLQAGRGSTGSPSVGAEQIRPFTFFGQPHELHIQILNDR